MPDIVGAGKLCVGFDGEEASRGGNDREDARPVKTSLCVGKFYFFDVFLRGQVFLLSSVAGVAGSARPVEFPAAFTLEFPLRQQALPTQFDSVAAGGREPLRMVRTSMPLR